MRLTLAITLSLILCAADFRAAVAQETPIGEAARELLRPDLRDKVLPSDTLSQFRTRRVPEGRVDIDDGVYRARYRVADRVPAGLSASAAAIEHVARSARIYGTSRAGEHLNVESVIDGR